jgi:hypothetical protein
MAAITSFASDLYARLSANFAPIGNYLGQTVSKIKMERITELFQRSVNFSRANALPIVGAFVFVGSAFAAIKLFVGKTQTTPAAAASPANTDSV